MYKHMYLTHISYNTGGTDVLRDIHKYIYIHITYVFRGMYKYVYIHIYIYIYIYHIIQVVPTYYVIFTSWAVLGSAILYGDLNETTPHQLFVFIARYRV